MEASGEIAFSTSVAFESDGVMCSPSAVRIRTTQSAVQTIAPPPGFSLMAEQLAQDAHAPPRLLSAARRRDMVAATFLQSLANRTAVHPCNVS